MRKQNTGKSGQIILSPATCDGLSVFCPLAGLAVLSFDYRWIKCWNQTTSRSQMVLEYVHHYNTTENVIKPIKKSLIFKNNNLFVFLVNRRSVTSAQIQTLLSLTPRSSTLGPAQVQHEQMHYNQLIRFSTYKFCAVAPQMYWTIT